MAINTDEGFDKGKLPANTVSVDTTNFSHNFNAADTNVQHAMETMDTMQVGTMIYPGAGIPLSTGSAWDTSITNNSAQWNTAYTDRLKWDGGSTGLTAATGRTSLGLGSAAQAASTDFLAAGGTAADSSKLGGNAANTYAPLASPTFTTQITTPKVTNSGNITIDAVNSGATSTVYILNSGVGQAADLNITGDLVVTNISVVTGGTLQLGANGIDGQLKIFSEQGGTDYMLTLNPNATMTGNVDIYGPAALPGGTYLLNMTTGGVIGYTNPSTFLTSLSGAVLTSQSSGQTIGDTTNRLTKLWATDITCTNIIAGEPHKTSVTVTQPNAMYAAGSTIIPLGTTSAAITVTRVVVTTSSASYEVAGDLKYADARIGLGSAALINAIDTSSGVYDSTTIAVTVASGKFLYLSLDSAPSASMTDFTVDYYWKFN